MMYVPTVMLYFAGVSVFVLGPSHAALADSKVFTITASLALFMSLVVLNIVGLGVGKWINNLGGIGTGFAASVLISLGVVVWLRFGSNLRRRLPRSRGSALPAELLWRHLLRLGRPRARLRDGR